MESKLNLILKEYDERYSSYNIIRQKFLSLISELVRSKKINIHSIDSRIKGRERLEEKIKRKDYKYDQLNDITDIIGIRIITFFEDQVDEIAEIIENEFNVDQDNSIDKRKKEHDKFGYLSLHYVIQFSKTRLQLAEYKDAKDVKAEIQIRSILQHAWAEIEHDIGYKNEVEIPKPAKRNFSRVAALLETADQEFTRLKNTVLNYENSVDNEIENQPENVTLDKASLISLFNNEKLIEQTDKEICKATSYLYKDEIGFVRGSLGRLKFLGIETIDEVVQLMKKRRKKIVRFSKLWIEKKRATTGHFSRGISTFYLAYVLLCEKEDPNLLRKFISDFLAPNDIEKEVEIFEEVCKSIQNA